MGRRENPPMQGIFSQPRHLAHHRASGARDAAGRLDARCPAGLTICSLSPGVIHHDGDQKAPAQAQHEECAFAAAAHLAAAPDAPHLALPAFHAFAAATDRGYAAAVAARFTPQIAPRPARSASEPDPSRTGAARSFASREIPCLLHRAFGATICPSGVRRRDPRWRKAIGASLQPEYVIVTANRASGDPGRARHAGHRRQGAGADQHRQYRGHAEIRALAGGAQTPLWRHPGPDRHPHLRRGRLGPQPDLCRRDADLLAHRQQQQRRQPAFRRRRAPGCQRIDVLYGPFAARYAGNSIGATINITTRMPDHFELYADALGAVQDFHLYGTNATPRHLATCRPASATASAPSAGGCRPIIWIPPASRWACATLTRPGAHQHRGHGADRRRQ